MNLHGRRRVGKSWLFRHLADGKPAVILVASRSAPGPLLERFAEQLEPLLGVRPALPDIASLFRVLFRAGRAEPLLAVVDEFPYLLGRTAAEVDSTLSLIQAVIEEEADGSQLKLILCGSSVDQMEKLQIERNPLAGRLILFTLLPLSFTDAQTFMPDLDPEDQIVRYAIAGGSPLYLDAIARGALTEAIRGQIVDPRAPFFNEPRSLLASELRDPATYVSILIALAGNPQDLASIGRALHMDAGLLSPHLERLQELRLVSRRLPAGASRNARQGRYQCDDGFFRFWFRFVEPYQADLEAGLDPLAHTQGTILPALPTHVSPVFEALLREWMRKEWGKTAPQVAAWWGAAPSRRGSDGGASEEIDAVGLDHKHIRVVGEAKWTRRPMGIDVLDDLATHKLPALEVAGFAIDPKPAIVLASRAGFTDELIRRAEADPGLRLLDVSTLCRGLAAR